VKKVRKIKNTKKGRRKKKKSPLRDRGKGQFSCQRKRFSVISGYIKLGGKKWKTKKKGCKPLSSGEEKGLRASLRLRWNGAGGNPNPNAMGAGTVLLPGIKEESSHRNRVISATFTIEGGRA